MIRKMWIGILLLMSLCLAACGAESGETTYSSSAEEITRTYVGRDCIFYHGQLYWNNGFWFSTEEGAQNLLPTDSYEEGQVSRCVKAMPQTEGEAALLPEGTGFLYHEAMDVIFVKKDSGYIQYIPMPGMKEVVEELCAMDPTGIEPGYDYMGVPYIFFDGQLYDPSFTLYELSQVGTLTQVGRIQCRCDAVPTEHLHSSNLEAGTIVYRGTCHPENLVIYREGSQTYQLYGVCSSDE